MDQSECPEPTNFLELKLLAEIITHINGYYSLTLWRPYSDLLYGSCFASGWLLLRQISPIPHCLWTWNLNQILAYIRRHIQNLIHGNMTYIKNNCKTIFYSYELKLGENVWEWILRILEQTAIYRDSVFSVLS